MKTTTQIATSTSWKTTATLLAIGVLLAGFSIDTRSQTYPMCAKFVGDTTILGSDRDSTPLVPGNDHQGVYCAGESPDVFCGSLGYGFGLWTTFANPSQRKAWIDLKNAVQLDGTSVPVSKLSQGQVEIELNWMYPNNPDGTCIPGAEGSPLDMVPGESYIAALRIRFWNTQGIYDLRFGQPFCNAPSSGCPVTVTAGADLDGDGIADIWTIAPSTPEAKAILFKSKGNRDAAVSSVIGYFQVPFTLMFTWQ